MKCVATLTFVLAAFIVPSRQDDCPGDFINFSVDPTTPVCIQFYMYGKITKGSWSEIRAKCQKEGADLAELKGDLHIQVRDYIFNHPELGYEDEGFWIGGSDALEEGKWLWISDNSPMDDANWWPGQPDGGTNANYACIYTPDFYIHSCDNDIKIYGLCQI
ncbi:low affinity immunoglobulin epsilon Fc receptor-like [Cherax quadricarinatus]|uniref:low affinity immunoglobulin epsilon Fc receptor-like n=1 Tax=Cherax quadricarinatus TaxID=27406 RepID=UPI00387EBC19